MSTEVPKWAKADDGSAELCFPMLTIGQMTQPPNGASWESCNDEGYNLEFKIQRFSQAPLGAMVEATCELSTEASVDCPNL